MKYKDIDMKVDLYKPNPRKKVMYKDYRLGKRIWEMEQAFNEAVCNQDHWYAKKYDKEIKKLYAKAKEIEDVKVEVKRYQ